MTTVAVLVALGQLSMASPQPGQLTAVGIGQANEYAYGNPEFSAFVNDSYRSSSGSSRFYAWLARSYNRRDPGALGRRLSAERHKLESTGNDSQRAAVERSFAASLDYTIKRVLPNFSLDRGFEFRNAASKGQRQCFLQSVLIAGLLQAGGVPAGVAMVNENFRGQETNNKHAVCIAKLSNGHDLIVDASEPAPFVKQRGLFVDTSRGYRFVRPVYETDATIVAYRSFQSGPTFAVNQVQPLDRTFIRSMFEYYRGERARGGVLARRRTIGGIASSAYHLVKSVDLCPQNPLAMYMLGKVEGWQNRAAASRESLETAMQLYGVDGWIPPNEQQELAEVDRGPL